MILSEMEEDIENVHHDSEFNKSCFTHNTWRVTKASAAYIWVCKQEFWTFVRSFYGWLENVNTLASPSSEELLDMLKGTYINYSNIPLIN